MGIWHAHVDMYVFYVFQLYDKTWLYASNYVYVWTHESCLLVVKAWYGLLKVLETGLLMYMDWKYNVCLEIYRTHVC